MSQEYVLYGRRGSGSWAVQAALEEINAAYRRVWVGETPEELSRYRLLNPTGRVPALALPDGTLMMESAAMMIHLAEADPRGASRPGSSAHAQLLSWTVFLSANIYDAVLRIYYSQRYSTGGEAHAEAIRTRALEEARGYLKIVAGQLAPYLLGAQFSLPDLYLHMLVGWFPGEKASLWSEFPALERHGRLLAERAAVRKVDADHAQ